MSARRLQTLFSLDQEVNMNRFHRASLFFAVAVCLAVCAAAVLLLGSTPVFAAGSIGPLAAPPAPH